MKTFPWSMMILSLCIFVPLFIVFKYSNCEMILERKEDTVMLKYVINYSFQEFACVSLFTSDNDISNDSYETLFQTNIPFILNRSQEFCMGSLILAKDYNQLKNILFNVRKQYSDRIVCYIFNKIADLHDSLKIDLELYGEAEVLIATDNGTYIMDSLDRKFTLIYLENSIQPWRENKPIYNFMGRPFKLATFNLPIFIQYGSLDSDGKPRQIKGIELTIFNILAKMMNISWYIVTPNETSNSKWGFKLPNGTWTGGIFKLLSTGKADIGMGNIFMSAEKIDSFLLTFPITLMRLRFLIRRPHILSPGWRSMFNSLPLPAWIFLLISIIINSLLVALITRLNMTLDKSFIYREYVSIWKSKLLSFGILMMTAIPPSKKEQGPLRFIINSWVITCFFVSIVFGSSLVSTLTTSQLEHRPESIKDLVEEGYYWGLQNPLNTSLILDFENPWHRLWGNRFRLLFTEAEHKKLLDDDKFVLWGKSIENLGYVMNDLYLPEDKLKDYEINDEIFASYYCTFALNKDTPLLHSMNKYLAWLAQSGIKDKIIKEEFQSQKEKYMTEVLVKTKPRNVSASLKIQNFSTLFYIYIAGAVIAFISFLIELFIFKLKGKFKKRYSRNFLKFNIFIGMNSIKNK